MSAPATRKERTTPGLRPDGWTIQTAPDRVELLGDLVPVTQADGQALPAF